MGPAPADDKAPADKAADAKQAEARTLLEQVAAVYHALPSYADKGESTLVITKSTGATRKETGKVSIAFARPNKVALDFGEFRVASDGAHVLTTSAASKLYIKSAAPKEVGAEALAGLSGNAFQNPLVIIASPILNLLGCEDAVEKLLEGTDGLRLEPDRNAGGKAYRCLLIDQRSDPDLRLIVDPKMKLVVRVEAVFDLGRMNLNAPEGEALQELKLSWAPNVITTEVPKGAFSQEVPEGYTKFDAPKAPQPSVMGLLGKPAPEFELTVLAGPGKTRTVRKVDLSGKVVVLDFWATWCGPCLKELPEIQTLADGYAKAKKAVAVVAIDQDEDPGGDGELRKLVEATLSEKKLKLAEGPISMVALDPKGEIGGIFRVEVLPTLILLDSKGVVQAIHLGYTEPAELSREIDSLLAGKSLIGPKAGTSK
jgi:thiol-disulfide isomerase/thioredoxin